MDRLDFFSLLKKDWVIRNEEFFGIPAENEQDSYADMIEKFKVYEEKYWNNSIKEDRCEICRLLENDKKSEMSNFVEHKEGNNRSGFFIADTNEYITIYGWFMTGPSTIEAMPVFILPRILEALQWRAGIADWIPRNTAKRNRESMTKIDNKVVVPGKFTLDCSTGDIKTFGKNKFSSEILDDISVKFMKAFYPDFVKGEDIEVFTKRLIDLPDTNYREFINYIFYDVSYFFDEMRKAVHMVNPLSRRKAVNLSGVIVTSGRKKLYSGLSGKMREDEPDCTLIINTEKSIIYAMDNYRSALYSSGNANDNFYFENTELVFDAFKTATSQSAGRIRTMLDDVYIGDDGLLYKKLPNGEILNQYELYKRYFIDGDKTVKTESLSCFTKTPFCNNNDPKRIMMTSKSLGQSIPLRREFQYDPVTHSTLARVCFGDFFGYNHGDGIVISETFAERTKSYKDKKIFIPKSNKVKWEIYNSCWDSNNEESLRDLSIDELSKLVGYNKNNLKRYNKIRIVDSVDVVRDHGADKNRKGVYIRIFIEIPTKVGDKFTNYHGSKGVISRIVKDEDMPRLIKDVGVMKAGPMDIIISSYGIAKRGNVGQILEAYARMKDFPLDSKPSEMLKDGVKEFEEPLIEYDDKVTKKAFGIQEIIRLQHLSISHSSFSDVGKPIGSMLNFGEMENLYMSAHDLIDIQKELAQRSQKFHSRKENINHIIIESEPKDIKDLDFNLEMLSVFYSFGYNISIEKIE